MFETFCWKGKKCGLFKQSRSNFSSRENYKGQDSEQKANKVASSVV